MTAKVDPVEAATLYLTPDWQGCLGPEDVEAMAHVVLAAAKIEGHWHGCETMWSPVGERPCTCGFDALTAVMEVEK